MDIIKPEATFYSDLGEPLAAASVVLEAGFGMYPKASVQLHPQVKSGVDTTNYAGVISKLAGMSEDSKKVIRGQLTLTTTDVTNKDSKEISLAGIITKPGYTTAYGAEPSYSLDIVHEISTVSSFNPSIYKLLPTVLTANAGGKQIAVPRTFYQAKKIGEAVLSILTALVQSYKPSGFDLSRTIKESIHKKNMELLPWVTQILENIDIGGGPDWKALLKGAEQYNLIYQIYTALTNRTRDYTANITSLFYMFGMVWYSIFDVEGTGDVVKGLSYGKLDTGNGDSFLEYAPAALSYTSPVFPTSSGLAPTHVVVESSARPGVLTQTYSPSSLIACYPQPPGAKDTVLFYKTNAPLWLPDGTAIVPIKYVKGGVMNPASIEPTRDKLEKVTKQVRTSLQTICEEWAELTYNEKVLLPETAELTIPMDLSIEPGTLCYATAVNDEAAEFQGLVWRVTHRLECDKSAVTQLVLRPVFF